MPGFDAGEAYVAVAEGSRVPGCSEGSRVPGFDAGEAYVVREAGCQDLMQGKHM